jgi:hypothetical protein
MEELIERFFEYLHTADISKVVNHTTMKEPQKLGIIITKILDWLKLERKRTLWMEDGKKTKHKPMKLYQEAPWCQELELLIQNEPIFNQHFQIKNGMLLYAAQVSEEEQEYGRILAYNKYNPTMLGKRK